MQDGPTTKKSGSIDSVASQAKNANKSAASPSNGSSSSASQGTSDGMSESPGGVEISSHNKVILGCDCLHLSHVSCLHTL